MLNRKVETLLLASGLTTIITGGYTVGNLILLKEQTKQIETEWTQKITLEKERTKQLEVEWTEKTHQEKERTKQLELTNNKRWFKLFW